MCLKITKKIDKADNTIKIDSFYRRHCSKNCQFLINDTCYLNPIYYKKLDKTLPRTGDCIQEFGFISDDERIGEIEMDYSKGYYCNTCFVRLELNEMYKGSCYECSILTYSHMVDELIEYVEKLKGDPDEII